MKKGITILISTYNGKQKLSATLDALSKLNTNTIPAVELILVDNASTDGTSEYTLMLWNKLGNPYPLTILQEAQPGKLNAQEKGLANAQYEYVITCDDDNSFFTDYLTIGYRIMENNPQIGILGGQGIATSAITIPDWFSEFSYYFACAPQAPKTGNVMPTRNVVYGAGMWIRMQGYHQAKKNGFKFILASRTGKSLSTGGEDSELCWALRYLGYEVWYAEELKFHHHIPAERLAEDYRKRLLYGMQSNGPLGGIYRRIAQGEIKDEVHFFWFKELIYTSIYFIQISLFSNVKDKKLEIRRIVTNLNYLIRAKSKYDKHINNLLGYYKKCKETPIFQS